MEKVTILEVSATKTFLFAGEELNVKGEVTYNPESLIINRISGSFYEKADQETGINGEYVGNFDGTYVDGVLHYSINDMTAANAVKVVGLVAEVDEYAQQIIQDDEETEPEVENE